MTHQELVDFVEEQSVTVVKEVGDTILELHRQGISTDAVVTGLARLLKEIVDCGPAELSAVYLNEIAQFMNGPRRGESVQ